MPSNTTTSRFGAFYASAYQDDLESRSQLSKEQRSAVLVAGLSSLPLSRDHLVADLALLLDQGCSPQLAEDTIAQMAAYIGFPRARQCMTCLEQALNSRDQLGELANRSPDDRSDAARHQRGVGVYHQLNPHALNNINAAFGALAGDVVERTFLAFGDVYALSEQSLTVQQFATISALGTLGCAAPQLRFHIGAGLNVGITQEQLVEIVAWIQFFAGAPAAYNALTELKAALAAGTGATPGYQ
ncbi:MAG: carboxymuconolactone decarboxylase family protein [Pseudomonadota bacterium]